MGILAFPFKNDQSIEIAYLFVLLVYVNTGLNLIKFELAQVWFLPD